MHPNIRFVNKTKDCAVGEKIRNIQRILSEHPAFEQLLREIGNNGKLDIIFVDKSDEKYPKFAATYVVPEKGQTKKIYLRSQYRSSEIPDLIETLLNLNMELANANNSLIDDYNNSKKSIIKLANAINKIELAYAIAEMKEMIEFVSVRNSYELLMKVRESTPEGTLLFDLIHHPYFKSLEFHLPKSQDEFVNQAKQQKADDSTSHFNDYHEKAIAAL